MKYSYLRRPTVNISVLTRAPPWHLTVGINRKFMLSQQTVLDANDDTELILHIALTAISSWLVTHELPITWSQDTYAEGQGLPCKAMHAISSLIVLWESRCTSCAFECVLHDFSLTSRKQQRFAKRLSIRTKRVDGLKFLAGADASQSAHNASVPHQVVGAVAHVVARTLALIRRKQVLLSRIVGRSKEQGGSMLN